MLHENIFSLLNVKNRGVYIYTERSLKVVDDVTVNISNPRNGHQILRI
jgi:hypothetical protein